MIHYIIQKLQHNTENKMKVKIKINYSKIIFMIEKEHLALIKRNLQFSHTKIN